MSTSQMAADATPLADDPTTAVKKAPVRSAERDRRSTCAFGDRVARACVSSVHSIREAAREVDSRVVFAQTCAAAFAVFDQEGNELAVVACGIGTKFISAAPSAAGTVSPNNDETATTRTEDARGDGTIEAKEGNPEGSAPQGKRHRPEGRHDLVCDGHGESVARRAFIRYLIDQWKEAEQGSTTSIFDIYTRALKPRYSIHMWSSSVPCGNACIRRWAKNSHTSFPDLDDKTWPLEEHEHPLVVPIQQRKEGKVAILLKRDQGDGNVVLKPEYQKGRSHAPVGTLRPYEVDMDKTRTIYSSIPCCSAKIAKWNVLGVQGRFLARHLSRPIYATSITIGRKFSRVHANRALCCRLAHHSRAHQPALMGTAVKMEDGAIVTEGEGAGPQFDCPYVVGWWTSESVEEGSGRDHLCIIDGRTGTAVGTSGALTTPDANAHISGLSRSALRRACDSIVPLIPSPDSLVSWYEEVRNEYTALQERLEYNPDIHDKKKGRGDKRS